ncbi:hypothetical protein V1478_018668 [Vespula squamosa]|uniref:Uncharacterized protein n=1 Tax=Vespula squamosa TaxID=30214 RepID=A0ABD1ZTE3_VESSQ
MELESMLVATKEEGEEEALASRRDSKHCKSESCLVECDKLMVSLLRREAPIENTSPVMSTKSDQSEWPLLRLAADASDTSEAAVGVAVASRRSTERERRRRMSNVG